MIPAAFILPRHVKSCRFLQGLHYCRFAFLSRLPGLSRIVQTLLDMSCDEDRRRTLIVTSLKFGSPFLVFVSFAREGLRALVDGDIHIFRCRPSPFSVVECIEHVMITLRVRRPADPARLRYQDQHRQVGRHAGEPV